MAEHVGEHVHVAELQRIDDVEARGETSRENCISVASEERPEAGSALSQMAKMSFKIRPRKNTGVA